MEDKDEYINSLLLSLLLMQIEINCLNEELDLARKGELVYINNPQIAELKAENDRLKEEIKQLEDFIKSAGEIDHINHEYTYKLKQTLQEIKEIAKMDICTNCITQKREDNCQCLADTITQLITKTESEG